MGTIGRKSIRFTLALFSVICLTGGSEARADVMESARMLPDDMLFMVSVESVKDLQAAFEKTSLHGLYKDPAMQPFITESEKKITELIDTTLKDLWQDMKIENPPKEIPYPEGRVVLGISLSRPSPAADGDQESGDDSMVFRFAAIADMGARAESAGQLIRSISAGATNAGNTVEKKDIGGLDLNVLVPGEDSDAPTFFYGLKDKWLVVTADTTKGTDFTESIVKRIGRSLPGSLADKAGLRAAAKTLGDAHVFTFVNADAVRSLVTSLAGNQVPVGPIIQALGLQNVTGISTALQVAGQKNHEVISRTLIGIDGPKTGIPALLGDASGPLKLNNRLVTRDAAGFISANHSPLKIFDGLNKIVQSFMPMDLTMVAQSAMQATAGEAGRPPVQLRDDVLAETAGPIFFTWQLEKPYEFNAVTRFLVGLSVQDAGRLDTALERIHRAFTGGGPDLRRELLDHTLYLLPFDEPIEEPGEENASAGEPPKSEGRMAFSVAGDSLVFGPVGEVEQAIRSLRKDSQDSLASDPMFRYAKLSLPSQACVYTYENNRLGAEANWTALKQLARDATGSDQDAQTWNPMTAAFRKIKDYVDFNKLPDFKAVEKYWGASAGYMQSRPEGLYWESVVLRPPQQ